MKFRFELLMSVTAMITAVAAVVVSVVQTDVMREEAEMEREHQRLSVMPSVWVENNLQSNNLDANAPGKFHMEIGNRGLGPAKIMYVTAKFGGSYHTSWGGWAQAVLKPEDGEDLGILNISSTTVPAEYTLPQDTTIDIFTIEAPTSLVSMLHSGSGDTEFQVCFCSLYDECWLTQGIEKAPEPIKQCTIGDVPRFTSRWN